MSVKIKHYTDEEAKALFPDKRAEALRFYTKHSIPCGPHDGPVGSRWICTSNGRKRLVLDASGELVIDPALESVWTMVTQDGE